MAFGKKKSGFSSSSTAEQVTQGVDGNGLTAIVTGSTSGIGIETARVLALRGVHVIMAVRNTKSGNEVKENILKEIPHARVDVMELDVSSLESVRKFAAEYNSRGYPLNILINNAGIMGLPFTLSKDGIEMLFATNHIGHFLLTNLLLDNMKNTAQKSGIEGRIVNVSSELHQYTYKGGIVFDKINDKDSYSAFSAYGQSKLANILHTNELTKQFKEEGVNITANSLHPGVVKTNIMRHQGCLGGIVGCLGGLFLKNVPQGAATTCYVALNPQVKGVSGEYFDNCNITKRSALAKDPELAKKLWEFSVNLCVPKKE